MGTIEAGEYPNIVPEQCTIQMDKRYPSDETVADFKQDIQTCIDRTKAKHPAFQADYTIIGKEWPPLDFKAEHDLSASLERSLNTIPGFQAATADLPYWGEAAFIQQYGTPALYFGPGSIKYAHSPQEHVDIPSIKTAFRGFTQIAFDTCFK